MHEIVEIGDPVHVHHNGDTSTRWGSVQEIDESYSASVLVRFVNGVWLWMGKQYVNKALLGLDGPICLRCTREALAAR